MIIVARSANVFSVMGERVEEMHPKRRRILEILARAQTPTEGLRGDAEVPTEREIGEQLGFSSSQTAHYHVKKLEEEGYVERLPAPSRKRRPVRLTERGWETVGQASLMGRIAAGRGLEAVANEEVYSLAGELLISRMGKRRYLLRVVGDSMIGAHIADGDLIVVEEDEDPPEGAVVVALVGGGEEVTVKKLYREGETVRLRPQNGDHEDMVFPASEITLQGRVVHVIHPPRR